MLLIKSLEPRPEAGVSHTRAPLQGRLLSSEIKLTPESAQGGKDGESKGAQEARKECL